METTSTAHRVRHGLAAALGLVLMLTAAPARAVYEYTSCAGGSICKYNGFVRDSYGTVSAFDQIGPVYVGLQRGKKGHLVRVEATASVLSTSAGIMDCQVSVNNQAIEAGALFGIDHGVSCGSSGMCFFTGTYWLDIDAGELANPGLYVNQPLDTVFICSSYGNAGQRYGMTMSVEMIKKK